MTDRRAGAREKVGESSYKRGRRGVGASGGEFCRFFADSMPGRPATGQVVPPSAIGGEIALLDKKLDSPEKSPRLDKSADPARGQNPSVAVRKRVFRGEGPGSCRKWGY